MKFLSTRGVKDIQFIDAVLSGYATDGGMILPEEVPQLSASEIRKLSKLNFIDLAFEILKLFITEDQIPANDLKEILSKSYGHFRSEEVVTLKQLKKENGEELNILELFHGPTYSFKDVALQFIGGLYEYLLSKMEKKLSIIVATSGDTGSAAIYSVKGKKNMNIFVLFPLNVISELQERQMTTVIEDNVFVIGVDGTSDDADVIIRDLSADGPLREAYGISSINSINCVRILFQTVHYFYGYFQYYRNFFADENNNNNDNVELPKIRFSIPSGGFGNCTAGTMARKMGLPIDSFIIAVNENNTLDKFFKTNKLDYSQTVIKTSSPAIDIQIPYNIERFFYFLLRESGKNHQEISNEISSWMKILDGVLLLDLPEEIAKLTKEFVQSVTVNHQQRVETIANVFNNYGGYIVDPHTSVGVFAAKKAEKEVDNKTPIVVLATAHPGKFADVIDESLPSQSYILPDDLAKLKNLPTKFAHFEVAKKSSWSSLLKEMITQNF